MTQIRDPPPPPPAFASVVNCMSATASGLYLVGVYGCIRAGLGRRGGGGWRRAAAISMLQRVYFFSKNRSFCFLRVQVCTACCVVFVLTAYIYIRLLSVWSRLLHCKNIYINILHVCYFVFSSFFLRHSFISCLKRRFFP